MIFPEVPREGLGRLRTALRPSALLVNQAAHELFHRHPDVPGFPFEP